MHPILKEGVATGTFTYKGSEDIHYFVENPEGKEFEISYTLYNALLKADGTKPLDLPNEGKEILPKLKKYNLVQTSRFVKGKHGINRFILFPIGEKAKGSRNACKAATYLLTAATIIFFIVGLFSIKTTDTRISDSFNLMIYIGSIPFLLAFHELGHLITGIAYGYDIRDTGILLFVFLPIGAYVSHGEKADAARIQRIHFALSGIQMNLLIAGVLWIVTTHFNPLPSNLVSIARLSAMLAGANLLPFSGFDGEAVLNELFDVGSISLMTKKCLSNKKCRRELFQSGLVGYALFCFFVLLRISLVIFCVIVGIDLYYMLKILI